MFRRRLEWQLISKYRSVLMGISILWIMAMHMLELYPEIKIPIFTDIVNRGNLGVDIFLYLSGIGLYFSLSNEWNLKKYYLKRIKRVLVPYLVMACPYMVWYSLVSHGGIKSFLLNYSTLSFWVSGFRTVWYIAFILIVYLFYPLIFKCQEWHPKYVVEMLFADVLFNGILYGLCPVYYESIEIALTRIPIFLLGSMSGVVVKERKKYCGFLIIICGMLSVIGMLAWFYLSANSVAVARVVYRYSGIFVALFICMIVSCVLEKCSSDVFQRHLSFLGSITLELYLIHIFMRNLVRNYGIGATSSVPVKGAIAGGIIMASIIISTLFHKIYARGNN